VHHDLAARAHDFITALCAVLQDVEVSREAVARWAHGFIDMQRRHINMEESALFPAAAKVLDASDWADLALISAEDDPVIGVQASERFEQLRKQILRWQSQDEAAHAKGDAWRTIGELVRGAMQTIGSASPTR
jgi:hemerythrin-like domain-containing protein